MEVGRPARHCCVANQPRMSRDALQASAQAFFRPLSPGEHSSHYTFCETTGDASSRGPGTIRVHVQLAFLSHC